MKHTPMQAEAEDYVRGLTKDLEDARQQLQAQVPLVSFGQLAARATVRTSLQRAEVSQPLSFTKLSLPSP